MGPKFYSSDNLHLYTSLWKKYRPALLHLMVKSSKGPQKYKLYDHEFKALNPKEKGYSFTLKAYQGKAVNDIRKSIVAKDLLQVLEMSDKASELMKEDIFEFVLDKQFTLHVTREEPEQEEPEEVDPSSN